MAEIERVLEAVRLLLTDAGLPEVILQYPDGGMKRRESPVVTLGLGGGRALSAGFAEYMGTRSDAASGRQLEIFGKRLDLTLTLGFYAPKGAEFGAGQCLKLFGQAAEAFSAAVPGIRVRQLECGETRYDPATGMFCSMCEVQMTVFLYAEGAEDDEFLDFNVRGVFSN